MREPSERADIIELRTLVQQLVRGRSNAVGQVTLQLGATTTTVTAPSIVSERSTIVLTPRTAAAAAVAAATYVITVANGSFEVAHPNAGADSVFDWAAIG